MRVPRSLSLVVLSWLLASFATAALAHVMIGWLGNCAGGADAYDEHAHGTVAPIALAAAILLTFGLLVAAANAVARRGGVDPVDLLARRLSEMYPAVPVAFVTLGGLVTLIAMEFLEQWTAFGHVEGIADALGGNVALGFAAVIFVAAALTMLGLRLAHALVAVAAKAVLAVVSWIVAIVGSAVSEAVRRAAACRPRRRSAAASFPLLAHGFGLRAPPHQIV